jgi:hypothetical protein
LKFSKKEISLIILHVLIGLNAIGGGYYGLAGAVNVPLEWLKGSPFSDYTVPSLILLIVVGGTNLLSAAAIFRQNKKAPLISKATALILIIWIVAQVSIIGFVSWLQPVMVISGLLIIFLQLNRAGHEPR